MAAAPVGVLRVGFLCLLAMLASASAWTRYPYPARNMTCQDTDGKRPGCTGSCPDRCPLQCIVLCPDCNTFCHEDVKPAKPVPPPAMFVFGDGALDVGNNAYLPKTGTEEGHPPQVSESSRGRFSNGANLADAIATSIGFEQSPPAYMSLRGGFNMWGANYASAGAGIKNSTNGERAISLPKQLEYFKVMRAQMKAKLGGDANVRELLSNSVFLLGIGGQDLINQRRNDHYGYGLSQTELQVLIALYRDAVTSLYDMGARKLAIVNVGHIGCMPLINRNECDDTLNDNAATFDAALKPLMAGFASKKSGLSYSIGDFYGFTTAVFDNPYDYGLVDRRHTWSKSCSSDGPCDDDSDGYWYWDGEFMTDRAAKLTAFAFYYGPPQFTFPITFKALLGKK